MSGKDERLDARLRGLLGGLDARAGFEDRVMARVASHAMMTGGAREDLCAQFERRREKAERRLRREAWSNGLTIAGVGVAAGAVVWRHSNEIAQWIVGPVTGDTFDPMLFAGMTLAAIGAGIALLVWRPLKQTFG